AAAQRVESVRAHTDDPASETERILLRALVLPEDDPARILASNQLSQHPEWFENLPSAPVLEALANAPAPPNPLDAAPDPQSRTLLALVLQYQEDSTEVSSRDQSQTMIEQVENALHSLESRRLERRQREIRALIAEADRRSDQTMLAQLTAEKVQIDHALRQR
ncbi:MAG: DNA primase, partial [Edaphobacter sp.]